ncbi:4-hydroxy-tetrahydrodipicolinate synthase [Arenibacter sp. TNZ]|jgi:4-hydroxy-tetrahydrodipicolinate synthase|uniref:4-hydroxy-tetrahydrodipicolinate synthase n=1 Tax=Arenibacter TaxID=178469 RepID=UPI000CD47318|nr:MULTISPECIES: 4-hydroxy-tetrahydrodipicolinate synthase [Arenibacter]MCM4172934.1 4-hydroxy-tetrahydrodipicolinate synthase [Arenibacter sp. TNZ]
MEQLVGTGVALVTPFKEDFSIDTMALTEIVNYCVDGGIDYLVVLGTTGESVVLSKKEKQQVIQTIVMANAGRLPLVLGVGGNNTAAVVEEVQETDLSDFVAILSVSPYYNRPTQEGIYQHFKAISLVSPKPIILYNVPGRTGSNMLPETVLRLANDFNNIIGIKEACGDMVQIMRTIKDKPADFMVISGDDFTALSTVLAGGSGVISVIGQGVPTEFSQMIRLGLAGKVKEAFTLHYALQDGMDLIFKEGNPAGIKALMETVGLCTAVVRLPLVEATTTLKKTIKIFLNTLLKTVA